MNYDLKPGDLVSAKNYHVVNVHEKIVVLHDKDHEPVIFTGSGYDYADSAKNVITDKDVCVIVAIMNRKINEIRARF